MKALNYLLIILLSTVASLAQATSLTPEQQAKEQGKILWNQYNDKALPLLLKAAQAGDQDSQYYLAEFLSGYGGELTADYHNNAYWYAKAAKQSNIYAMYRLTNLCNAFPQIKECTPDQTYWHTQAMAALKPKIAANNPEALYQYYVFTREINYLKQSAEAGFPEAQYRYGEYLENQQNEKESFNWYKKAADNGHVKAIYSLALYFVYTDEKLEEAQKYLLEAADESYINAIDTYSRALNPRKELFKKQYAVQSDKVKSYAFSILLAEIGIYSAKSQINTAPLSADEKEKAKLFAEQWKKAHPPLSYYNSPVFNSSMDR